MGTDKEINDRLWMSNTIKANLDHCSRLADVCGCRLDAESAASYITDIAEGNIVMFHCRDAPLARRKVNQKFNSMLRAGGTSLQHFR